MNNDLKILSIPPSPNNPEQIAAQRFTKKILNVGFVKEALHVYQDADGQSLYWRIRLKNPITGEKWIRPLSRDAKGRFVLQEPAFFANKPLYQLPNLLKNITDLVWVVEGELCADYLNKLGIVATTSGGMDSVASADWTPLAKRSIVIWPDNDEAGIKYATNVSQRLTLLGCDILWIDVEQLQLPIKGDCVNWILQNPNAVMQDILNLPKLASSEKKNVDKKSSFPEKDTHHLATGSFKVNERGVYYLAEQETLWICSKLEIKALTRDNCSENWGRLLEITDADGQLHIWAMPMEMLKGGGEEIKGELMRLGLQVAAGNKARNLLVAYIIGSTPDLRARCIHHVGWHNGAFSFPTQTIGNLKEQHIFQTDSNTHTRDYQVAGTLEEWRTHVSSLCSGNSRLVLGVSCAFAAMLLNPAAMESGGIHFVGESSSGKTTLLRVAASVFGGTSYLNRWRGTTNGLEALAALRNDTLLILDELAQVEAEEAGEIAYMLANGSGKIRATKNGGSRQRCEWRLLFLSAGEVGLAQHMLEADKKVRAGQEVRLVDIPTDAGKNLGAFENIHSWESAAEFSDAVTMASSTYYGSPAIAFLNSITQTEYFIKLPLLIKTSCDDFVSKNLPSNCGGQVFRVCKRFGLIATAGKIATTLNLTGWDAEEAEKAASTCFKAWLEHRGGAGNQENNRILSQVRAFFEAHAESRFSNWQAENSHTSNRAGFKKIFNNEMQFYVLPEIFRKEICMGWDFYTVSKLLLVEGWVKPDRLGKAYRREYLPGIGRSRCYVFTTKMWNNEQISSA